VQVKHSYLIFRLYKRSSHRNSKGFCRCLNDICTREQYNNNLKTRIMALQILEKNGTFQLFGNLNTLALQPLGHIAGTATSCISSLQTLISIFVGGFIGQCYDGRVQPLIWGFMFSAVLALLILLRLGSERSNKNSTGVAPPVNA